MPEPILESAALVRSMREDRANVHLKRAIAQCERSVTNNSEEKDDGKETRT